MTKESINRTAGPAGNGAEEWSGNERYKRMIKFGFAAVILLLHMFLFFLVWTRYYNPRMEFPFWRRGNWLMTLSYGALLLLLHQLYGGLRIGYLRRANVIYSQTIALIIVNIAAYIELILVDKHFHNPGALFLLAVVEFIVMIAWAFLFQWFYNILFPPRQLLVVYGDRPVFRILKKINARDDKYVLAGAISVAEGTDRIMEEAPKYGGIILGDIPSHERNLILKQCYDKGIRVYLIPKISDLLVRSSSDLRLFDTSILLSRNEGLQLDQAFFKRLLDIVSAGSVFLLFSPIFLVLCLAIRLEDGGPVFYTQDRLTLNGKIFRIMKFRTMRVDAEKDGVARLAGEHDDRITKVGHLLRSTRLDELPQVINILKGEMSMVGPRPERPEIAAEYEKEIPEFRLRLKVKAGLTGLAQIYGLYNTTPYDKLKLDLAYIRNYSFFQDLKLIFMTPKIMFMKEATEGVEDGNTTASLKEEVYGKQFSYDEFIKETK